MVDRERLSFRISATAIRADVHANRCYLATEVYADFVQRIVVLGGESSGKTSLAEALAAALGTRWATEYGRERWIECSGQLDRGDLLAIADEQRRREDALLDKCDRYLVCDTDALTTLGYGIWMFGERLPALEEASSRTPWLAVLCEPEFPFQQDGTRRDALFRDRQHRWYLAELQRRGWPLILVRGSVEDRVRQVAERLGMLDRPPP